MSRRQQAGRPLPTLKEIENWPPTVSVPLAGSVFGLSRSHAYELAKRGEFPVAVLRVGERYKVVTQSIIKTLEGQAA